MTNLFTNLSNWKVKYICTLLILVCVGVGNVWGATFNKITSLSDLTTGNYVIVGRQGSSSWGILRAGTISSSKLTYSKDYSSTPPTSITTTIASEIWYITVSGSGTSRTVQLYNAGQKKYLSSAPGNLSYSDSKVDWTSKYSSGFCIYRGSTYYLGVNKDYNYWRDYMSSTLYNSSGYQLTIYKEAPDCSANPSVGSVSLNGSFNLSSIPLQATVSSDGGTGCTITEAGFVWTSDGTDPTISNNKTTGTYSTNITGTIPSAGSFSTGVTYKIKAYATNGHGDGLSSSSFTLIPRSVTFNLNGHGSSTPATQYVNNGGYASNPSYSESVTGYTFGGWYKEAGCSNSWTFASDAVSGENKTLYAKWTANEYTIELDPDLTPTTAGATSITATYNSNSNLTDAIDTPTKTGWTFAGYYTEKNGNGTQIIDADGNVLASVATYTDASKNWIKASGVTLYAKWTCTVTWSVNNSTSVYDAQTLVYNGTSTKVASVPGPPSPASYCGDKFVGWTTEENVSQNDDTGLNLFTNVAGSPELKTVGNTTFYAVFADYDE